MVFSRRNGWAFGLAISTIACAMASPARCETLESALIKAYQNNLTLNSQRAAVRATDEVVPQALSGYRPRVGITANGGEQSLSSTTKNVGAGIPPNAPATYFTQSGYNAPFSAGATITQTLYNGFQTANRTRQAESQVLAANSSLNLAEQTALLDAATAYMNVLRDGATFDLQRRNVEVLENQLRQTRDRHKVGDVTATDVAQSESRLAAGRSQVLLAEANYKASVATYRQVIGTEPVQLSSGTPVDRFSPSSLPAAIGAGIAGHPSVIQAEHNVDVALSQTKVAESALYPTLSVQGSLTQRLEQVGSLNVPNDYVATVLGTLTVPIFQGGAEYSQIRQAKETLGQKRIDLAVAREQVRQNINQSWDRLVAAKANIDATQAQVQAAEIALNGVRDEARAGQRTTLDVLNAQQELLNARVAVVTAQRDRVVASYTLLGAVGRLSAQVLALHVPVYQPRVHYHQVRDNWVGVRTPDGR